jgi:DNA-binding NarL/FixJ family response regulator
VRVSIRVLIADDQAMVRAGLSLILRPCEEIEIVGEASDAHEAVEAARRLRPDVVLMDVRMPRMDGIEATRRLLTADAPHHPRVPVLTTFDLDEYVYDALRAGAGGFMLKDEPPDRLLAGIRGRGRRRAARADRDAATHRGVHPAPDARELRRLPARRPHGA